MLLYTNVSWIRLGVSSFLFEMATCNMEIKFINQILILIWNNKTKTKTKNPYEKWVWFIVVLFNLWFILYKNQSTVVKKKLNTFYKPLTKLFVYKIFYFDLVIEGKAGLTVTVLFILYFIDKFYINDWLLRNRNDV